MIRDDIEEAKWAALSAEFRRVEAMADKHRLMLVRFTQRRFLVVQRGGAEERTDGVPWAYWQGSVLYGPATRELCVAFIRNNLPEP
jgi:hypothetical protein